MLHTYFLGILLCVGPGLALYDSGSDVVDLTPDNFNQLITDRDEVWLVEFYAPWCGHCKNLVPEYKKAARALKGIVKVGAIDADKHRSFAKDYGVSGFPTIKIFTGRKHVPYKGARTADAFVDAALSAVKSKAYEKLGRRADDSSHKPSEPETYGHNIPWKQAQKALRKGSKLSRSKKVTQEPTNQATCKPNTTDLYGYNLHGTTKSILRKNKPFKKVNKKKNAQKTSPKLYTTTQPTTSMTTENIEDSSRLTILDKFKLLQSQLFRGDVSVGEKPKIIKALLRLKYVLQGKGLVFENATIVKRRFGDMQG